MKTYYSGLDILRFFAAFWIMNFHYFLGLSPDLSWYRYGNLGVPLFFIISGFVISESISRSSIKKFATSRFIRLAPIFWIICTATYIFTLIISNGNPVSFAEYLVSMTMLGDKFGALFHLPRVVDAVYWSLAVEIIFYFAIALFVYIFKWKNIRWFLCGWLIVSVASFYFDLNQTFIAKTLLVRHASYFIFGATLSLIVNEITSKKQKYFDYFLLLTTAVYSTVISYKALPPYLGVNKLDGDITAMLHPVFFMTAIFLIYTSKYIKGKLQKIFTILGGLTYHLYLIHQTVGNILIDYYKDYLSKNILGIMMIIFMITLSYFIYIFDKKLRGKLKEKLIYLLHHIRPI